ncbi:MAG: MBL fold metallo-hydrolase [Deltaproteobacteria bacterium]|nr:MBL fold metallo-hydrolase [Deltaproteobacteria bacterium]
MAIAYAVLASGSKGNCTWVRAGDTAVLVDCGLSALAIRRRLEAIGESLAEVSAVICTHGHGDHVAGAAVLARKHGLRIHGTVETLARLPGSPPEASLVEVPREGRFALGDLTVQTVPTLHDAPGSFAVRLEVAGASLGVITDLGLPSEGLIRAFSGLTGLVLEMNHDEEMLLYGPYPEPLKRRIRSDLGHLSNAEGAALLARLLHPGLQQVTLAHLSETNNLPEHALSAARSVVGARGRPTLTVARQGAPGERVDLEIPRGGQLGLPLSFG